MYNTLVMAAAKKTQTNNVTIAKTDDGSIQMTFILPWAEVEKALEASAKKLSETVTIPGFRQGKAPLDAAMNHIPRETLVQETVGVILPSKISQAYKDNDITPIMYPKIELLHAHDGEDWEIRATTAQLPEVKLGDYKAKIKDALAGSSIWTPEKGQDAPKEMSAEEKENVALRTLIDSIEVKLPAVLIEEEANHRIGNLLARLEKLGLSLESYLSSQNKDPQTLRAEYAKASGDSLKIELILGKIAEEEKLSVSEMEVEAFAQAAAADPSRAGRAISLEEKNTIRTLLTKRKAIDHLVS